MLPIGTPVPSFRLENAVDGREVSPEDFADHPALLVMFICNHCPFVKHVMDEITRLGEDFLPRGVGIIAINANDPLGYPQDGPENMKRLAEERDWGFPFVLDETQDVAKRFRAACTPDFFVFDGERQLAYRGQLDDSRPGNDVAVTGRDLRAAIEAVLAGDPVSEQQKASIGCNIKWRPGNAPPYFG
jgi:thiol-disulfide isomerase/thioredoxin